MKEFRVSVLLTNLFLLGFLCFFLMASLSRAQEERIRTIERSEVRKNEPFAVIGSRMADKTIESGRVLGNRDWLKELRFTVKNVSTKSIVYFKMELRYEPNGKFRTGYGFPISFGTLPSPRGSVRSNKESDVSVTLAPSETVEVTLDELPLDVLSKHLEKQGVIELDSLTLYYERAFFDDRTGWSRGQELKQNPENESEWRVVSEHKKSLYLDDPNAGLNVLVGGTEEERDPRAQSNILLSEQLLGFFVTRLQTPVESPKTNRLSVTIAPREQKGD